jgi:molybdopterin/thiamine biosynthesis adenylyltransferase/rhodanese-related sulfurtransferase
VNTFSKEETERYSRHLVLQEIGPEGQKKLKQSSVLLVGAGGLGSAQAVYLAAAGVGRIGLIDNDVVALSNLQRQVIYRTDDVGRSKVETTRMHLHNLNPFVEIQVYDDLLQSSNALEICGRYDLIIDGSDNFATRYLTNDTAVILSKPNVYASIYRFEAQISVFGTNGGPCYRCLFPYPPAPGAIESCAVGGVLGVLPGIAGSIQALEAIKLITGIGESLSGRLLLIDGLKMHMEEIKISRNEKCPVCGNDPVITSPIDYDEFCGLDEDLKLRTSVEPYSVRPGALKKILDAGEKVKLIDIREPGETRICNIKGSVNIPSGRIGEIENTVGTGDPVILYCRSGIRSARILSYLRRKGFENIKHLAGGILNWIEEVDPTQPRY